MRDDVELYSYVASGVTSILIFFAAWQLTPVLGPTSVYLIYVLGVVLNSWIGGIKTGLIVTIFGTLASIVFFLFLSTPEPVEYLRIIFEITLFALAGVLTSFIIEKYKRTDLVSDYRKKNKRLLKKFDQMELQMELMKNEIKMRDEFLSIASHELRNPLTTMLLKIEKILHNIKHVSLANFSVENLLQMLETAEDQTKRLSRMINDLLNVSLITTGKLNLEKTDEDMSAIVHEVAAEFSEKLEKSGIALTLDADTPILISVDRLRISQVLTNIISNAIKYGDGKPIRIATKKQGNIAKITISDHGLGIAKEQQDKIFQLFERGTAQNGIKGLGVGLYISNQIVKAHGGIIRIDSELGNGSVFTIELPL